MINVSLQIGIVPEELKNGFVTPIIKKPSLNKNDFKNYRPVTNLSFLSKILENVVYNQLIGHIKKYELFDEFQSAYREGHSIETVLASVKNEIEVDLDHGYGSILVLLDGSAAFDTVEFSVLLQRLRNFCFGVSDSAIRWFKSYIYGRTQQVVINNKISKKLELTVGVPKAQC